MRKTMIPCFYLIVCGALMAGSLSVQSVTGQRDSVVNVDVTLAAQADGLASLQFDVGFNGTELSLNASAGPVATTAAKQIQVNTINPGKARILVVGLNQNVLGDGVVAVLEIGIKAEAQDGVYQLTLSEAIGSKADGSTVVLDVDNGSVTVGAGGGSAPNITAVVHGASFTPPISPQTWITIQGTNLASTQRIWEAADFQGDNLPTALDGTSVSVNGRPAYVFFISPGQLNVLTGMGSTTGPVDVQVRTTQGTSNVFSVDHQLLAPGFFMFTQQFVAAVHNSDGVSVGKPNLIPGAAFRPAKPGDVILLYGSGFGPTNPPAPDGVLVAGAPRLSEQVTIRFGTVPAQLLFAGVVSSGLVQFNVIVPDVPDGDVPLIAEAGAAATQASALITVQR